MSNLGKVALLAALYILTGKLGLLLAVPPGYATIIWPASGIALGMLLVHGWRLWPGVLLGSLLLNAHVSGAWSVDHGLTVAKALLALSIAVGSTAQALVGYALIRRLVTEYGVANWKRYAVAFVLMGIAAACMAVSAYLFGHVVNQAYVDRDFRGLAILAGVVIAISLIRAAASYGATLTLLRIGNRIVAANQRRMFEKLLQESLGFFADRHSSEFALRLTTGAIAANQVLTLLIAAVGRDLFTVIGLVIVMIMQDPVLFSVSVVVFPPALLGRLVTIPYYPLSDEMLGSIVKLQLGRIKKRVEERYKIPFNVGDDVVKLVVSRCTESESGGRMIDAILTNTMLPAISREFLNRMMQGHPITGVTVDVKDGDFHYNFDLTDTLRLSASVDNILDADPPHAREELGYDPRIGNPLGRTFEVGIKKTF